MPRKPPRPPGKSKTKNHDDDNKNNCTSFLDEEICIEAKVTVKPEVSIGKVKIECLESCIEPHSNFTNKSSEECSIIVSQLIRVKIPIRFSAKAEAEKKGVNCMPCHSEESSDESSNLSSSS
ncbi:hypothetical protein ABE132_17190 [Peribacillus simplex]|uniref:hypothetical protein n=1 Tax=Peribacillus simplex TaxID=1478 RepID=UPI003D2E5716